MGNPQIHWFDALDFDYEPFRQAVEDYYRSAVGRRGRGVQIAEGVQDVRIYDSKFTGERRVRVEYSPRSNAW